MGEYLDYKIDMKGHKTEYEYYAPGFLESKVWTKARESVAWGTVDYVYNADGSLWKAITEGGDCGCSSSTRFHQYNNNGQIINHTSAFGNGYVYYDYDGIGRLDEIKIPDYAGSLRNTVTYGYDAANRLTDVDASISSSNPANATMTYNKANQITHLSLDGGSASVGYQYNSSSGRLSKITTTAQDKVRTYDYGYNNDGLRTSTALSLDDFKANASYGYDNLNRLTNELVQARFEPSVCIDLTTSGYVSIASGGDLGGSFDDFTIDMRILVDAWPSSGEAVLFERGSDGSGNWIKLSINTSGMLSMRIETNSDEEVATVGPISVDEWIHVA
ncbi:MAG: hypothetical protein KC964_31170, partial [Candidatus Omnitrophica bacterium]|nr:hypothetical protein [Candidatus Omnitrophota bacterium]